MCPDRNTPQEPALTDSQLGVSSPPLEGHLGGRGLPFMQRTSQGEQTSQVVERVAKDPADGWSLPLT